MFPGVSLFLLFLYQKNVSLTICGCWFLQSLKRNKSNKFTRLQIEVFLLPNISPLPPPYISQLLPFPEDRPIKFVLCPYIYAQGVLTGFYGIYVCIYIHIVARMGQPPPFLSPSLKVSPPPSLLKPPLS